jgi:alpha-L-rhamnosidase
MKHEPRLLSVHARFRAACFLALVALQTASAALRVEQLRCEYLDNPLGIDTPQPRLSWILGSSERGAKQSAYQILVAGSASAWKQNQGDLWDSGKVPSDETIQVRYAGQPLATRQQAFWKVRVWDEAGQVRESQPARWEMGLLSPADWQARWIARTTDTNAHPAPLLRRAFQLDGKTKQARAYICGLGYYEL